MSNFAELNLDSVDVAKALRYVGITNKMQFNMTQLNKLLYIAYGIYLVRYKIRLTTEHPAAWPYGPVFPRVTRKISLSDTINAYEFCMLSEPVRLLLAEVTTQFGDIPANKLSAWSHKEGSPWSRAIERSHGKWNEKLDDEDIFDYFYNFVKMETPIDG